MDLDDNYRGVDEKLTFLFPYNIETGPPEYERHFVRSMTQLDVAMEMTQPEENKNDIILSAWQTP